jgi:hypothetical protein
MTTTTEAPPKGEYREMRPNKMFPPQITALIRAYVAAKGEQFGPCPVCGKKKRGRWTMLCPFRAYNLGQFKVIMAGEYPPLTLVCCDHPINPSKAIMAAMTNQEERDDGD